MHRLQPLAQGGRSGHQDRLDLVDRPGAADGGRILGAREHPDRFHPLGACLGRHCRRAGDPRSGSGLGVDGVVLAEAAPGGAIGSVDLDDLVAGIDKLTAQPGSERTGALGGKDRRVAELLRPGDQLVIALAGGGNPAIAEPATVGSQGHSHMDVLVGVDTDHDIRSLLRAGFCQV